MKKIELTFPFPKTVLVDVVHHDSNEEPEDDCINRAVSFKVGNKVYQYFQDEFEASFEKFDNPLRDFVDAYHSCHELRIRPPEMVLWVLVEVDCDRVVDSQMVSKGEKPTSNELSYEWYPTEFSRSQKDLAEGVNHEIN